MNIRHRRAGRAFTAILALALPAAAQAQNRKLTVHPGQRFASLEMTASEYQDWKANDGYNDGPKREGLVKELYASFRDEFDFIFLVLNETQTPASLDFSGQLFPVSNQTRGLGASTFDASRDYGSAGRLKSVMALTKRTHIQNGPGLHELMHTWGNFGISTAAFDPFGPGCCGGRMPEFEPHWGFTGGDTRGQLGGFRQSTLEAGIGGNPNRYKAEPFGQFANGGNAVPYSQMELYLMGMIPVSQVAPFDVFRNVTAFDQQTYEFEAATRVRYDSARIESELGRRSPTSQTSQKDFRLLIVVLSGAPLTAAEMEGFDRDAERFGRKADDGTEFYNFWEATGGRGTLETGDLGGALKSAGIIAPYRGSRPILYAGSPGSALFDLSGRRTGPRDPDRCQPAWMAARPPLR